MKRVHLVALFALVLCMGCGGESDDGAESPLAPSNAATEDAETNAEGTEASETPDEGGDSATESSGEESGAESSDEDGESGTESPGEGGDASESGDSDGELADVEESVEEDITEEEEADVSDVDEPQPIADLVINEVVVKAADNGPDWVEIHNRSGTTVQLEGWGIRDELNAHEYLIPAGSEIPSGGYFVVWGKNSGMAYEMDFSFNVDAKARLFAPDMETLVDEADWEEGDAPAGTSWGRYPDGTGEFQMLSNPTLGKENKEPDFGEEADVTEPEDADDESEEAPPAPFLINEVLVLDTEGANCWAELYNPNDVESTVSGWYVKPDILSPASGIADLTVEAKGFSVLECNADFPFVLLEDGSFWLMNEQALKVDKIDWMAADVPIGQSYGRVVDGGEEFTTFITPTPGASNQQ